MKKKIIITVGVLIVLMAIAIPWYLLAKQSAEQKVTLENQAVIYAFTNYYKNARLVKLSNSDKVYVVYRQNDDTVYVSLFIDGLWVEVGELRGENPAP